MICKKDVCAWFKDLTGAKRIDLMCGLIQICLAPELRFLGSCLEDLCRKDYSSLRALELDANNLHHIRSLTCNLLDDTTRAKWNIVLSLLQSTNTNCANAMFTTLCNCVDSVSNGLIDSLKDESNVSYERVLDDILLLYTMASSHPAFTFLQRGQLYNQVIKFQSLLDNLKNKEYDDCRFSSQCSTPRADPSTSSVHHHHHHQKIPGVCSDAIVNSKGGITTHIIYNSQISADHRTTHEIGSSPNRPSLLPNSQLLVRSPSVRSSSPVSVTPPSPMPPTVAGWLKAIRLHKYTDALQKYTFDELMNLTDAELDNEKLTLGARKKIRKEIEALKNRCSMNGVSKSLSPLTVWPPNDCPSPYSSPQPNMGYNNFGSSSSPVSSEHNSPPHSPSHMVLSATADDLHKDLSTVTLDTMRLNGTGGSTTVMVNLFNNTCGPPPPKSPSSTGSSDSVNGDIGPPLATIPMSPVRPMLPLTEHAPQLLPPHIQPFMIRPPMLRAPMLNPMQHQIFSMDKPNDMSGPDSPPPPYLPQPRSRPTSLGLAPSTPPLYMQSDCASPASPQSTPPPPPCSTPLAPPCSQCGQTLPLTNSLPHFPWPFPCFSSNGLMPMPVLQPRLNGLQPDLYGHANFMHNGLHLSHLAKGRPPPPPPPSLSCYNCGHPGHRANECSKHGMDAKTAGYHLRYCGAEPGE